jgi:hypothetical protein
MRKYKQQEQARNVCTLLLLHQVYQVYAIMMFRRNIIGRSDGGDSRRHPFPVQKINKSNLEINVRAG